MGAYASHNWYKSIELTFSTSYLKYMYSDAIMAVVFGYREPLFFKIRECAIPYEIDSINTLERSYPLNIYVKNGNLIISN